ncbi:MAG: alpha/beta fold hydrolase [Pseudomonadota bacterium]
MLLHSSMSSKSQWRELIESLGDSYRPIAIDLLGYGESAMPGDSYSLNDEVRLVESVLAHELQPGERFHLVGHSYGGMVALQLAAQPQRHGLRSLTLFEPIAFHLLPDRDPDLAVVHSVWREIEGRLNAGDAHGAAQGFVDYWSGEGAFAQLRDTRQQALADLVPKVLREFRTVADEACNAAAYRCIEVPVCLAAGLWSPEPAQRLTSMFAELLPQASCFEVAAGHMAPITHPALVNPIFERFIRVVDAGERARATERPRNRAALARGQGRARAATLGLLGLALSVMPLFATQGIGQCHRATSAGAVYPLEKDAWHQAPPGLPAGATFAVVSGDPLATGPFVMRVRLPAGFTLPRYRRQNEEQVIVLDGALTVGTASEDGAETSRTLTSGSYVLLPANEIHFANTTEGAIVQIFGIGPFRLELT